MQQDLRVAAKDEHKPVSAIKTAVDQVQAHAIAMFKAASKAAPK